jgi:hypothetical protein
LTAFAAGIAAQLRAFRRHPITTLLTVALPVNLLLLLSLFALTGYRAPTALVVREDTPMARAFVQALDDAHHSFALRPMDAETAERRLRAGRLVAIIEIPEGFDEAVRRGSTVPIRLTIDNVNLDLTDDVRRAVPAASAIFAARQGFPEVRITPDLRNVLRNDTGYVEYLGVSAIALAACISGGVLGGTVTAREWEHGTARLVRMAPGGAAGLVGRLTGAAIVGTAASALTALVVWVGYGVVPQHPFGVAGAVVLTVGVATALGGLLGALLKRTLPVTPLVVGLTLPFYLDSGALEPQRFDGPRLFAVAHASPTYYGVGLLERAFHGLVVTPEPPWLLATVLAAVTVASASLLARSVRV